MHITEFKISDFKNKKKQECILASDTKNTLHHVN